MTTTDDHDSGRLGNSNRGASLKVSPWLLACLAVGFTAGLAWSPRGAAETEHVPGMTRQELAEYVQRSFVRILDPAFRDAGAFEASEFDRSLDILLVAPNCAPSARVLEVLRREGSVDGSMVLVSASGDEEWIRALHPELPIADAWLAELVRTTIPIRVGPTLIETRLRTVV